MQLGTDTWYYAKRCFTSLFEMLAKHMILLKDPVFQEILQFFDTCELHGRQIPASVNPLAEFVAGNYTGRPGGGSSARKRDPAKNNISSEARLLKSLYLRLYE